MVRTISKQLLVVLFSIYILSGCDSSNESFDIAEFRFSPIFAQNDVNGRTISLSEADRIVFSINESSGESTEYSTSAVEITRLNGELVSQKISLPFGDYELVEFLIVDDDNHIIYAVPKKGSLQGQNVTFPLPINFSLNSESSSPLDVEIVSTENMSLEDLGLLEFDLSEIDLLKFELRVSNKNNPEELLIADLTVESDSYSYEQQLKKLESNTVIIKDGLGQYEITLSSEGYTSYSKSLSRDEISAYENAPLVIELEPTEWTPGQDFTDLRDGQVYKTIELGDQVWMAENLNYKTDGSYYYDNDSTKYAAVYGRLYNWEAMMQGSEATNEVPSGVQGVCPKGWHVPSLAEYNILKNYLNATGDDFGGYLKEPGLSHWISPNSTSENNIGFNALPAGIIWENGTFANLGSAAYLRTTHMESNGQWVISLFASNKSGYSEPVLDDDDASCLRCLKD